MDFFDFLVKSRGKDTAFLNDINFSRILDKIKSFSKEKHLIIIDEKIKKISMFIDPSSK
jgi:hypothetical protein